MSKGLDAHLKYYGISPWEIEVLHSNFNARFNVIEEEIEQDDPDFVSLLNLDIPLPFNEEFFQWFDFRRWEKIKALFKEMKRRRGSGKGLKIQIEFLGSPTICFVLDAKDRDWFQVIWQKLKYKIYFLC